MKQLEISGQCIDLSMEEMISLDGGASWVVKAAYWIGRMFGEIAEIQEWSGDTGQWMA